MQGKRSLVLGLGVSGRAAVRLLRHLGSTVVAYDKNQSAKAGQGDVLTLHHLDPKGLRHFDQVIVSPGFAQDHPLYAAALFLKLPVFGEIELALRFAKQPLIGITGTNGKTTVTMMTAHALRFAGLPATCAGNIGRALSDAILDAKTDETIAVELSSWQLETAETKKFAAGIILNLAPDHLDRHKSMQRYAEAKMRLGRCMQARAPFYVSQDLAARFSGLVPACALYLPENPRTIEEANSQAALALCQHFGVSEKCFFASLRSFCKPPHRMEKVASIKGVEYYNDSKATNIDASMKAVLSLKAPCILIAGGMNKGGSFFPWKEAFAEKVRCVCAIGQAAKQIEEEIGSSIPVLLCGCLEEALRQAVKRARPGENVLLSPGCASFDQYESYEHRGKEFCLLVKGERK